MKSVDEIQKMKVAELKQELSSRGLDSKGVKAILVDRLIEAISQEEQSSADDVGNGIAKEAISGVGIASDAGHDEKGEEVKDKELINPNQILSEEIIKRPTRAQSSAKSNSPSSPTPKLSGTSPLRAVPPSPAKAASTPINLKTAPVRASSPQKTPNKSSVTTNNSAAQSGLATPKIVEDPQVKSECTFVNTSETQQEQPQNLAKNATDESSIVSEDLEITTTKPEMKSESDEVVSKPEDTQSEMKDMTPASEDREAESEMICESEPKLEAEEIKPESDETSQNRGEGGEADAELKCETEAFTTESKEFDESMEEESDSLKRKHDETAEACEKNEEDKGDEEPKKIRLEHYTVRILPEEEPEFDPEKVLLDWYISDLNIGISKETFLRATPTIFDGFPWAYAGVKATYGFRAGKLAYQVKWIENLSVNMDFGKVEAKHVLRVGWSDLNTDLQLGEETFSYGLDSESKIYNATEISEVEGLSFAPGSSVTVLLDLESDPVEITFRINNENIAQPIQIPKSDVEGKIFFPHILARNVSFEVDFDGTESAITLPDGFIMVGKIEASDENRMRGPKAPKEKKDCEFVMLCGMACAGKTTWAKTHKIEHLEKHFNIIGTSSVVERAVKKTTLAKDNTDVPRSYDTFLMKAGRFVEKLVDLAPSRRRNYILDQSNVMPVVQRRKAAGFEGFKRRAVVVLPNDEDYQKRIKDRENEQGKSVPKSTLLDMKATFRLPEVGEIFSEVDFSELTRDEAEPIVKNYNKEGADAGYFGQKPNRGGWFGSPGFRGGRSFRGGNAGGFRGGPRRGGPPGGFHGGPFRPYMRGGSPRGGPGRVPRDFSRTYSPPTRRGGVPPLIPRRSDNSPRWGRGGSPSGGRGGGNSRMFHTPRNSYGGGGGRGGYGGNQRQQQSPWASGGSWSGGSGRGGYSNHPSPWVQQVPDQGFGQSWGETGRGGRSSGGSWQGHGGQSYGYGKK